MGGGEGDDHKTFLFCSFVNSFTAYLSYLYLISSSNCVHKIPNQSKKFLILAFKKIANNGDEKWQKLCCVFGAAGKVPDA